MNDEFVASVKGITKALDTGIKLAKRISKSVDSPSGEQALHILETTRSLQKSLEEDSQAVGEAYRQCIESCGEPFTKALIEDKTIQNRLKDLRIDLIDQINECQDFDEDEPDTFDKIHFIKLQAMSKTYAAECVSMFNGIRDPILLEVLRKFELEEKARDDRAQLSSMRKAAMEAAAPPIPPAIPVEKPSSAVRPAVAVNEPVMPKSPWVIDNPAEFSIGSPLKQASPRQHHRDISSPSKSDGQPPPLIPKEAVDRRLSVNDEFLERRRQSRILFQQEIRLSTSSAGNRSSVAFSDISVFSSPEFGALSTSADNKRASDLISPTSLAKSPIFEDPRTPVSPIDGRGSRASGSGYGGLMERQRSQGGVSQASRGSRTSSIMQSPLQRTGSQASQDSIFGLRATPLTPPLSDRGSGGNWGTLATTLKVPGYGNGVESGLEVVGPVEHHNEKILANENNIIRPPTTTSSMKSIDHPMRHDSSFYRFGGFCEGGKSILRGDVGFKQFKRPVGQFNSIISARCTKCSYEVLWADVEKDRKLDRSGIYTKSGIRWRQQFVSKCHVKTNSVDEPLYACIFCIDDHKTVEEHDATIFFSVTTLFRHLAKHTQPLPKIPGIDILYGPQPPHIVDFDLHFPSSIPQTSEFSMSQIATKIATRPSGYATATHRPKNNRTSSCDPEGNPHLHFASGARIVGITFPAQFKGLWCTGYHDGSRGSFPSSSIILELPPREDVLMDAQSKLIAFARWDFKPKDAKEGGWLKFSKGERIVAVGYTFQDQWCWSGQNAKGKWGLFPAGFVEGLQEGVGVGAGGGKSGGLGLRIGSFPIGRMRSSRGERSESVVSNGSGSGSGNGQPGLEVVTSRTSSRRS